MSSALFIARHLLALVVLLLTAVGAGALVAGRRGSLAPRFLPARATPPHPRPRVETASPAALLSDWGRRETTGAGPLAAAFFLGSPIVVALATVTYVDAALTLFVTAGFYCLDRSRSAH